MAAGPGNGGGVEVRWSGGFWVTVKALVFLILVITGESVSTPETVLKIAC